jgi:Dynein heavy chain AAA lid domain
MLQQAAVAPVNTAAASALLSILQDAALDQAAVFAVLWGVGGSLTGDPATAFDVFFRDLLQVKLL